MKFKPVKEQSWSWNSNTLAIWCEELIHLKRPWCWEGLWAGGEGDDRGWDGWMASPTQWTRVWVSSGSWWWTGRSGVLQSMGSQRVGYNWAAELNWTELKEQNEVRKELMDREKLEGSVDWMSWGGSRREECDRLRKRVGKTQNCELTVILLFDKVQGVVTDLRGPGKFRRYWGGKEQGVREGRVMGHGPVPSFAGGSFSEDLGRTCVESVWKHKSFHCV